jgi:membrane protease YdiL (CAAX protease family)
VGLAGLCAWLRRGIRVRDYLALRPVRPRQLSRWVLAALGFGLASDLVSTLLNQPIVPEVMADAYRTAGSPALLWAAMVLCAPVGEEIFFRGFLFRGWLDSRLGAWGTVLLTASLWSAVHQQYDAYGIATVFAAGLLFGYARLRTGSLYPVVAMHAVLNAVAMIQTVIHAQITR